MGLRTGPGSGSAERLAGQEARPEKGEPSCLTRLAQHVGKADVSADRWVQLHPGGHGVQLPCLVQLIQEGLRREEAGYRESERGREAKSKPGVEEERWQGKAGTTRLRKRRQGRQRRRVTDGEAESNVNRDYETERDRFHMRISRTGKQRHKNMPAALPSHDSHTSQCVTAK